MGVHWRLHKSLDDIVGEPGCLVSEPFVALDAISSVFIGGAAVQGGVGTVIGSMIGGMIQGVLANGMNLNSVGIDTQMTIKGLVLLFAVAFDVWSKNRK